MFPLDLLLLRHLGFLRVFSFHGTVADGVGGRRELSQQIGGLLRRGFRVDVLGPVVVPAHFLRQSRTRSRHAFDLLHALEEHFSVPRLHLAVGLLGEDSAPKERLDRASQTVPRGGELGARGFAAGHVEAQSRDAHSRRRERGNADGAPHALIFHGTPRIRFPFHSGVNQHGVDHFLRRRCRVQRGVVVEVARSAGSQKVRLKGCHERVCRIEKHATRDVRHRLNEQIRDVHHALAHRRAPPVVRHEDPHRACRERQRHPARVENDVAHRVHGGAQHDRGALRRVDGAQGLERADDIDEAERHALSVGRVEPRAAEVFQERFAKHGGRAARARRRGDARDGVALSLPDGAVRALYQSPRRRQAFLLPGRDRDELTHLVCVSGGRGERHALF